MKKRTKNRAVLRSFSLVIALLALSAAAYAAWRWSLIHRRNNRLLALQTLHCPTRVEEWELIGDPPNGADALLVQALFMLQMPPDLLADLPVVSNSRLPEPDLELDAEILEKTHFLLDANTDFFTFLELYPVADPPIPPVESVLWHEQATPLIHHCLRAQQILLLRLYIEIQEGTVGRDAVRRVQEMLLLTELLSAFPNPHGQHQAARSVLYACRAMDLLLNHSGIPWTAAELDGLKQSFQRLDLHHGAARSVAGAAIRGRLRIEGPTGPALTYFMPHLAETELSPATPLWLHGSAQLDRKAIQLFELARSTWKGLHDEPQPIPPGRLAEVLPPNTTLAAMGGPFLDEFASLAQLSDHIQIAEAWRAIALQTIAQVVGEATTGLDPFSGEPIRVVTTPAGATAIYSLGPNGTDEGGQTIPLESDRPDLVFLLMHTPEG